MTSSSLRLVAAAVHGLKRRRSIRDTTWLLAAIAVCLCVGSARSTAAQASGAGTDDHRSGIASSMSTRSGDSVLTAVIHDPGLNMDAYTVTYPAGWYFEGTLAPSTPCAPAALVYRINSPDGLSEIESLPKLTWTWSDSGHISRPAEGCLLLKPEMSAAQLVRYMSAVLEVEYVADHPVPQATLAKSAKHVDDTNAMWARAYKTSKNQPPTVTAEWASAAVRYLNGTVAMQGRLNVALDCTSVPSPFPGQHPWSTHSCSANVYFVHAPDARFAVATALADTVITETVMPGWLHAYAEARYHYAQRINFGDRILYLVPERQNRQLLPLIALGVDSAMQRAARVANTDYPRAADWADFVIDGPTMDALTVAPAATRLTRYTWSDTAAKAHFHTDDPQANPNGSVAGPWTREPPVVGGGSH